MNRNFEAEAADFLKSESGGKLKAFAASPQGQEIRSKYAQEGEALRQAVKRGDMAAAETLLKDFLESSEGKKIAQQLENFLK